MIHAQAVDLAVAHELIRQSMGVVEDGWAFGTQRNQRVDVEEPAVVELLRRRLPTGEAMMLAVENRVESIDVVIDLVEHELDLTAAPTGFCPQLIGGVRRQRRNMLEITND